MNTRNHGKEANTLANKGDLQSILYSIIMFVMAHHSARYGDDLNRFPHCLEIKANCNGTSICWVVYTRTWAYEQLAYNCPSQPWPKRTHSPRARSQLCIGRFQNPISQHFVLSVIFLWNRLCCCRQFLSMLLLEVDFQSHYRRCQNCLFHWQADNQEEWNGYVGIL